MLKGIWKIIQYESRLVVTDYSILLTILIAPIFYAFFLGTIYLNNDIEEVPMAIIDMDQSASSREMTRAFNASQEIKIVENLTSLDEGIDRIYRMDIQGFIYFPSGFEADLLSMRGTDLGVYINTTQFLPSNNPNKSLQKILLMFGANVRLKYYAAQGIDINNAVQMLMPLTPKVKGVANPTNAYGWFLLPGLFILILHQTLLFGIGESFCKDRQRKVLPHLLALVDGYVHRYIFGKAFFYMLLYLTYFVLFLSAIFPFFQLNVEGSWIILLTVGFFMAIATLMFGIFLSSLFRSQIGFLEMLAFTSYPFFLLSGFSWPLDSMHIALQYLSQFSPMTSFVSAYTRVLELGAGWEDVSRQIINLILLSIVYGYLGLMRWKHIAQKMINDKQFAYLAQLTKTNDK